MEATVVTFDDVVVVMQLDTDTDEGIFVPYMLIILGSFHEVERLRNDDI